MNFEKQIMSKDKYPGILILSPNGGFSIYHPPNIFFATGAVLGQLGTNTGIFPSFSWAIYSQVTRLDKSHANEII